MELLTDDLVVRVPHAYAEFLQEYADVLGLPLQAAHDILVRGLLPLSKATGQVAYQVFGPIWADHARRLADEAEAQAEEDRRAARLEAKLEAQREQARLRAEHKEMNANRRTMEDKRKAKAEAQAKWREKRKKREEEEALTRRVASIDTSVLAKTTNASGYVGVYAHARRWRARVVDSTGQQVWLTVLDTPEEAAWERYTFLKDHGLPTGSQKSIELAVMAKKYMPEVTPEALAEVDRDVEEIIAKTRLGWTFDPREVDAWVANQEKIYEEKLGENDLNWVIGRKEAYLDKKLRAEEDALDVYDKEVSAMPAAEADENWVVIAKNRQAIVDRMLAIRAEMQDLVDKGFSNGALMGYRRSARLDQSIEEPALPVPVARKPKRERPDLKVLPPLPPLEAPSTEVDEDLPVARRRPERPRKPGPTAREVRAFARSQEPQLSGLFDEDPPPPPPTVVEPLPPLSDEEQLALHLEMQAAVEQEMKKSGATDVRFDD
jgi:hypothetical protein